MARHACLRVHSWCVMCIAHAPSSLPCFALGCHAAHMCLCFSGKKKQDQKDMSFRVRRPSGGLGVLRHEGVGFRSSLPRNPGQQTPFCKDILGLSPGEFLGLLRAFKKSVQ